MSPGALTSLITTAGLPERERFDFWREAVYNASGIEGQPISLQPFFGELEAIRVKEYSFSHLHCRGHRCSWTRFSDRAGVEAVIVTFSLRGKAHSIQDGREVEVEPGSFRFLDTTRPFLETMDEDYEALSFLVPRETWLRRIGPTEQVTSRTIHADTYMGGLVFNFFRQLVPGIGTVEPATADRLAEMSLALLSTLSDTISQDGCRSSGRISLLSRAKALIEENLCDPGLNPERIAQALRISERYLRDLFHEEGTTVCNWMWDRRVERCREMLSDPLLEKKSISAIAFGCGFNDSAHFNRRFKEAYSTSPSEFRREHLAGAPG